MNSQPDVPTLQSVCPVSGIGLKVRRGERELLSIEQISFGLADPDINCSVIVGPNGAGKSLLVRVLCNLLKPDSGQVAWGTDSPTLAARHRVGLVLQKPVLLRRSALENLAFALRHSGLSRARSAQLARQSLCDAGLDEIAPIPAQRLSGGEQQRVALLRALLLKPDILFLDEATANVDPASTRVIEDQLKLAIGTGLKVVMVSHDQGQVRRMADEVVLVHQGKLIERALRERFFNDPQHRLTRQWVNGDLLL